MTSQAIILDQRFANQEATSPSLFSSICGHPFLHYQLLYLSNNLFDQIIILYTENKDKFLTAFGEEYLGMKLIYLPYDSDKGQNANIFSALEYISKPWFFIFHAHQYFRLNINKATNFRRMRDARIINIGKNNDNFYLKSELIFINEKGRIINIITQGETEKTDTFNTDTWLVNKATFVQSISSSKFSSLFDFFSGLYKEQKMYCLSCRQYFIRINNNTDLEKASHDFEENYF